MDSSISEDSDTEPSKTTSSKLTTIDQNVSGDETNANELNNNSDREYSDDGGISEEINKSTKRKRSKSRNRNVKSFNGKQIRNNDNQQRYYDENLEDEQEPQPLGEIVINRFI